jgi:CubicO group peptidase (beta-lactamase class C family)
MRLFQILAFIVMLAVAQAAAQAPASTATATASADELVGLWKAKRRFGPDAHGALIIQRTGATYTADMVGRIVPVRVAKGELSFDLPNGQGMFRGKLVGKVILGHWVRPGTPPNLTQYVSPVRLKSDRPNHWSGEVISLQDEFTLYLLAQKLPDGSLSAVLRNPERDFGAQIGVERLIRDGNVVKLIGKPRGQKEDRELSRGTYDADNQVITFAFPNRGGSYDFRREGDESDFYPRGKNSDHYTYHQPPALDDGWPTGTLEEANIDRTIIEKLIQKIIDAPMDSVDSPQVHAVLIARHGKLVLEEYFHGEGRDRLHETRSASKSVVAVVAGAAMQAGAPLKLSSPVYQVMNGGVFPPDLDPQKRMMTLEHLLTMSSGYFCDDNNNDAPGNETTMLDQTDEPDYYRYTMKVPLATTPGEKAVYCSASPNLALGMVGRATGEFPPYTFDRLIGGPMKINRYAWSLDAAGNPYGGGSIQFLPRDFMKFGQLMLNGGTWEGRRILSRDFVARASSPLYHIGKLGYGYLWWGIDYPYKGHIVHAFYAGGTGGQGIMVIPDLDLVITTFAGNYSSRGSFFNTEVPKPILLAVQ